ncbi:carbohydrate esterase family 1 protein, partial [Aureobasidium melanogenum]
MAWKIALLVLLSLTAFARAQSIPTASQCPSADGQTITDSNGSTYRVTCSADNSVGSYTNTGASSSYLDCMTACDAAASAGCQGFTYVGGTGGVGSGTCWLKKSMGSYPSAPANYISAIKVANAVSSSKSSVASTLATSVSSSASATVVAASASTSLSCPSSNFTTFVDSAGKDWQILCGFDTNPGSFGSTSASSFTMCLAACEATTNCAAVTYIGTACYFKKAFSSLITNPSASSAFMINTQNYPVPASGNSKASSGCGSALPAGIQLGGSSTTFNITSNGVIRSFNIHVPTSYKNNKAAPLIVAYHGRSNNQLSVESDSQLSSETWNPYAISVYPLGINEQWEGDPATVGGNYDDLGFTSDLLDYISTNYCIDTSRMLAAGFSNGGGFVGTLACDPTLSTRFSTFAANSGAEYTNTTGTCNPPSVLTNTITQSVCSPGRSNLPMLEFHGDADGTIPYPGGPRRGYCLPAVPHWVTDWALRDGLSNSNVTTSLASGNVTKYEFGASKGVQGLVTHYKVAGWGHAWVSINAGAPIDATPIVMDFFYAHSG